VSHFVGGMHTLCTVLPRPCKRLVAQYLLSVYCFAIVTNGNVSFLATVTNGLLSPGVQVPWLGNCHTPDWPLVHTHGTQ
jgi:hypothetical protein